MLVHYCGVECQKADWRSHKPICKFNVKQQEEMLDSSAKVSAHGTVTKLLKHHASDFIRLALFVLGPEAGDDVLWVHCGMVDESMRIETVSKTTMDKIEIDVALPEYSYESKRVMRMFLSVHCTRMDDPDFSLKFGRMVPLTIERTLEETLVRLLRGATVDLLIDVLNRLMA